MRLKDKIKTKSFVNWVPYVFGGVTLNISVLRIDLQIDAFAVRSTVTYISVHTINPLYYAWTSTPDGIPAVEIGEFEAQEQSHKL